MIGSALGRPMQQAPHPCCCGEATPPTGLQDCPIYTSPRAAGTWVASSGAGRPGWHTPATPAMLERSPQLPGASLSQGAHHFQASPPHKKVPHPQSLSPSKRSHNLREAAHDGRARHSRGLPPFRHPSGFRGAAHGGGSWYSRGVPATGTHVLSGKGSMGALKHGLAACLYLCLCLSIPPGSRGQQPSSLQGQGVDPVSAGAATAPVPVYLSVILMKILNINEVEYKYHVVVKVVMSWRDPRAQAAITAINFTVAAASRQADDSNKMCAAAVAAGHANASSLCTSATSTASNPPSCTKVCDPTLPSACCDGVWLPDVTIRNSVGFSQDRFVQDKIGPIGNESLVRSVRVQGEFSNSFDFHDFPFDSQVLELPFEIEAFNPSLYYLVASYVGRANPNLKRPYTAAYSLASQDGSPQTVPEEVTGWSVTDLRLICNTLEEAEKETNISVFTSQEYDPNDPLVKDQSSASEPPPYPAGGTSQGKICFLRVYVDRDSTFYVWNDVFPVILTTVIAFACFITSPTSIEVRLSTAVTLFLALVALQFIIVDQLPKTTYLTAFGALVLVSYAVFFLIIVESVLVYYLSCLRTFQIHKGRLGDDDMDACMHDLDKTNGGVNGASVSASSAGLSMDGRSGTSRVRFVSSRSPPGQGAAHTPQGQSMEGGVEGEAGAEEEMQCLELEQAPRGMQTLALRAQEKDQKRGSSKANATGANVLSTISAYHESISRDPHAGYRIASLVDRICAPCIFIAYALGITLCFVL